MLETVIDYGPEKLRFMQAQDDADIKKIGHPAGHPYCWIDETGKKLYHPFEVISRVTSAVNNGTFSMQKFTTAAAVRQFFADVNNAQRTMVCNEFRKIREQYKGMKEMPGEVLEELDRMIRVHETPIKAVGIDGMVRCESKEEAVALYGKEGAELYERLRKA